MYVTAALIICPLILQAAINVRMLSIRGCGNIRDRHAYDTMPRQLHIVNQSARICEFRL